MKAWKNQKKTGKLILLGLNLFLIAVAVVAALAYSNYFRTKQKQMEIDTFCTTIESMKQISNNYLDMELGYAEDWAKYISQHDMTIEEALEYIRQTNNQSNRYAHIVDMDTYQAYSTYMGSGSNRVKCYETFAENDTITNRIFIESMKQMYASLDKQTYVLGKYRTTDTQLNVLSVGTRVTIRTEEGSLKDYLLLRIIPVESMRDIWVFPVQYDKAEIGIITKSGDYVVPSNAMRSRSFVELIRAYNFEDNYNQADVLIEQLQSTDSGLLKYKNAQGRECYWYYSSFGDQSGFHILGYIPADEFENRVSNWQIVLIVCGILGLMVAMDGAYILRINRKLREAVVEAKHANQAKTRFLSTMSHDIRTPMNAIIGMTDIAKRHVDEPAYMRECLNKVSLASDHLLTLINDILDISKVESGNMALNPAPFSVEQTVAKLVNMIRLQMQEKDQKLEIITREITYKCLIADELRLNQIYINLLNNAVKYTNQGGKISLTVWEETIPGDADRVWLMYQVRDTGIGMSEEFQKNMYRSFEREMDSRINKTQGTGLGLAIAKQMVDMMDGGIRCESKLGEGTTFTVSIPLPVAPDPLTDTGSNPVKTTIQNPIETTTEVNDSHMGGNEPRNVGAKAFEGIHVLIAEDNDINWEIICEQLKEYGVTCERAENGQICVDMLRTSEEGHYDLILMDVQMPEMNGKEATREIRRSDRAYDRDIMIVAMTADAFAEDMQACLDAGMDGHIAKPVDMKKVLDVLEKVKGRKGGQA